MTDRKVDIIMVMTRKFAWGRYFTLINFQRTMHQNYKLTFGPLYTQRSSWSWSPEL